MNEYGELKERRNKDIYKWIHTDGTVRKNLTIGSKTLISAD